MSSDNASVAAAENPNEKLAIPSFLNEDYFLKILESDYPDFRRIIKFTPNAATSPGENYMSVMVRAYIDIELKDSSTVQASYVLKIMIEGSEAGQMIRKMNVFPKEVEVYHSILPQFEKLYADCGKTVHFGPQCKFVEETPERITIVMEDLKPRKFHNIDRQLGLDSAHMEQVLKKLAEFHAASAVHYERYGPYSECFNQSFITEENREFLLQAGTRKRAIFLDILTKWGDCEKYIDIWPQQEAFLAWYLENQKPSPNELNVLNHGDLWSNNIMFNYNEDGEIDETIFVDFQLCKWRSPAQDLYYTITSSAGYDIRVKEFDKFIRIYHENLTENLSLLKFSKPIPSLKDLHILMIRKSLYSYFTGTSVLPAILLDANEDACIENFLNGGEFLRTCLMNLLYVKAMKQLLPWWENRGLFQFDN